VSLQNFPFTSSNNLNQGNTSVSNSVQTFYISNNVSNSYNTILNTPSLNETPINNNNNNNNSNSNAMNSSFGLLSNTLVTISSSDTMSEEFKREQQRAQENVALKYRFLPQPKQPCWYVSMREKFHTHT
jgi:hypothetical protein